MYNSKQNYSDLLNCTLYNNDADHFIINDDYLRSLILKIYRFINHTINYSNSIILFGNMTENYLIQINKKKSQKYESPLYDKQHKVLDTIIKINNKIILYLKNIINNDIQFLLVRYLHNAYIVLFDIELCKLYYLDINNFSYVLKSRYKIPNFQHVFHIKIINIIYHPNIL